MGIHQRFPSEAEQGLRRWTPREKRFAVDCPTVVTNAAGLSRTARISNLSNKGCRIITLLQLRPGERLQLVVEPLGLVEAEVRWTEHNDAGLRLMSRDAFHDGYEFSLQP